jgi:hypothetical protein
VVFCNSRPVLTALPATFRIAICNYATGSAAKSVLRTLCALLCTNEQSVTLSTVAAAYNFVYGRDLFNDVENTHE